MKNYQLLTIPQLSERKTHSFGLAMDIPTSPRTRLLKAGGSLYDTISNQAEGISGAVPPRQRSYVVLGAASHSRHRTHPGHVYARLRGDKDV